jgi:hypothetical protein
MKKMPCLFVREFHVIGTFTITEAITPGCEWAIAGEGIASRKWDGTAVLVKEGRLYARYDAKKGKAPPAGAIPCTEAPDPVTGHWPHWVLADGPQHKWIREAHALASGMVVPKPPDGTYEACGENIQGNPQGLVGHLLIPHTTPTDALDPWGRTFSGIRAFLGSVPWEGIVFHHPDGRMCKIRRKDFGLPWPVKAL